MGKNPPKWLPGERVNETILLQRKSVEQLRADRLLRKDKLKDEKSRMKAKLDAKRKKKLTTKKFVSAATILDQAVRKEKVTKGYWKRGEKFNTRLNNKANEKVDAQYKNASVALVIRTSGTDVPKETARSLDSLGLDKMYQARLIHLSPQNDRLTKMLKSFVTVGFPTVEQAEKLIRAKGRFWNTETKAKFYITGNMQVEQTLGDYNVLSIEELVDAVVGKNEHIDKILKHLAPFDMQPPRGLYMERFRSKKEKDQIENPHAFSAYMESLLIDTAREKAVVKKADKSKRIAAAKLAKAKSTAKRVVSGATKTGAKKSTTGTTAAAASKKESRGKRVRTEKP